MTKIAGSGSGSDPDPDSLVRGMDPEHWLFTLNSRMDSTSSGSKVLLSLWVSPEHDHGLLTNVIRILGDDEVDVLFLHAQLAAESNPVPAQQVGDVGDPQVRPVDRVEFPAVAGLAKEAVFRLQ